MGGTIITCRVFNASGTNRGSNAGKRSPVTNIVGQVTKVESHTPSQFVITVQTTQGPKRLKIGERKLLNVERGGTYEFPCRPNVGTDDGAVAAWRVAGKPGPAMTTSVIPRRSNP